MTDGPIVVDIALIPPAVPTLSASDSNNFAVVATPD